MIRIIFCTFQRKHFYFFVAFLKILSIFLSSDECIYSFALYINNNIFILFDR